MDNITICPPGPPREELFYDQHVHLHGKMPIDTRFIADGEVESTGIDYADYARMHSIRHKLAPGRRRATPVWATNSDLLRALVVRYMEYRGLLHKTNCTGTEAERLKRAQSALAVRRPQQIAVIDGLCKQYVQLKREGTSTARLKALATQIKNIDSQLVMGENTAAKVFHVVNCYYQQGLDSVATGLECHLQPPAVRQILWRLARIYERLNGRKPSSSKPRKHELNGHRAYELIERGYTWRRLMEHFGIKRRNPIRRAIVKAGLKMPLVPRETRQQGGR